MRDYQDRLRVLDARAREEGRGARSAQLRRRPHRRRTTDLGATRAGSDRRRSQAARVREPVRQQRRLSRRPENQRPDAVHGIATRHPECRRDAGDSVHRRGRRRRRPRQPREPVALAESALTAARRATSTRGANRHWPKADLVTAPRATSTDPIAMPGRCIAFSRARSSTPCSRIGWMARSAAPVNCLVTNPLYSHSGRRSLIPAGARVLGETKPVQAFGETRLAVAFHRC